ncbi:MAG TPA: ABC transporter ATP-binding protein, partial [Candidatus Binataceae bacterium]|nr:ABC transporter ATP-binding protein [Candidatus Binataceae bacterium]
MPASKLSETSEALVVDGVGFTYHDGSAPALKSVSFTQMRGEVIGVMGASGAGKSTLAKCLNRIIPEFEGGDFRGVVRIAGREIAEIQVHDLSLEIGMVFQDFESQLFSTTVAHEVAFAMEQAGVTRDEMRTRIAEALDAVGLCGFEERDPSSLSGGQKQRLAIASVLALRPRVIVLDEPTTDLDPEGRAEVFALLRRMREHGLSLIVIEHESTELRSCDRLILLAAGEVVAQGPPETMLAQLDLLERNGVHPPSLNRALALLGIDGNARNIDDAEAMVRGCFPNLPRVQHIADKPEQAVPAA